MLISILVPIFVHSTKGVHQVIVFRYVDRTTSGMVNSNPSGTRLIEKRAKMVGGIWDKNLSGSESSKTHYCTNKFNTH